LRDVYDKVEKQALESASINAKLDLYIGLNNAKNTKVDDHENRIRTIERWVFAIPGISVILSVAGLVIAVLKG
jgi:hypothetical protein